jgi:hypothetical protein
MKIHPEKKGTKKRRGDSPGLDMKRNHHKYFFGYLDVV